MAKVNFKDLLLNKGDKALLGFGAVGLGLLFVWSVSAALGGPDSPSVTKSKLESEANRISGAVASNNEVAYDELPAWVTKKVDYATFDSQRFALASPPFEPTNEPSRLRDLPPVLTPVPYEKGGGVQVSLIRAPMPAWDVKVDATTGKVMIGILDSVKVKSMDQNSIRDFRRRGQSSRSAPAPRLQQPPVGLGAPGGGEGMPGGGPGGGRGGMPGGPGDMMGMGMGGSRAETVVRYVTPEEFDANRQYVQAVTVEPLRMLSVQMAFPLKQQFEEIRKALKLPTLSDAIAQSGYLNWQSGRGLFAGIEVRRMEITAAGDKFDWADLKHEEMYRDKIFRRKIADVEDDGYLSYFALPSYYQRLAVPYPLLADGLGSYDTITLNAITESIERLKTYKPKYERPKSAAEGGAADQNPFIPSYGGGQFGGAGGLFSGGGIGNMQGPGAGWAPGGPPAGMGRGGMGGPGMGGPGFGGAGGTGSPDGAGPGAGGPGFGGGRPGLPGAGGPGFGGPGAGGAGGTGSPDGAGPGGPGSLMGGAMGNPRDPKYYPLTEDFLLIRFLDTEIRPGNTYQYQIRVIMNNPNFGKQDVSQAEYGKKEKIEGPWWTIPGSFTIPQESYIYAITPKSYEEKVKEKYKTNSGMQELLIPRDGKTVVQIQSWSENVRLKDFNEPIGTWIVGEIPTGPGEFIGRKHLLQLPTWSAERAAYALKELPGGVKVKGSPPRDTPRGWIVDLSTAYVLVDFDGGKYRGQVGNNNVQDEADVELLILKPDGKLMIRNSAVDMAFENRKVRAENWENWIRKSEEQAMRMTTPAGAGPGGGFGRGGTGSPDGP